MAVKRPAGPPPTTTACVDLSLLFELLDSESVLVLSVMALLDTGREVLELDDDDAVNVSVDLLFDIA